MNKSEILYNLIYLSSTSKDWPEEELQTLLNSARKENQSFGITGILLHTNNKFMQVLEGPETMVSRLYNNIKKDKRHSNLLVLMEGCIHERIFGNWSMAFKQITNTDLETASGYKSLEHLAEEINTLERWHPSLKFLQMFYENNKQV